MQSIGSNTLEAVFSGCRRVLKKESWDRALAALGKDALTEDFPDFLATLSPTMMLPPYIAELARLEWLVHQSDIAADKPPRAVERLTVNPTLGLHPFSYKNLPALLNADRADPGPPPEPAACHVMIWRRGKRGETRVREAAAEDLLALKLVVEQIDVREAAIDSGVPAVSLQAAIDQAVTGGLLLSPPSRIRRNFPKAFTPTEADEPFLSAETFTLQWHITQACDLHCRHCYDRSERAPLARDAALRTVDEFHRFCRQMHVNGQITFTGGNPLLYPHFADVYRAASGHGFTLAILGNPSSLDRIRELAAIQKPALFQISLEGLEAHNDYIRGPGHFQRSLEFLDGLRSLNIYAMVMLTLTRDNMDQVLPLADLLQNRADHFTFNRLSMVGEGAALALPSRREFKAFLKQFEAAAENRPFLGPKDNLINILRQESGRALLGGCTGFGCGAAFNFVALLPDGEVHACRKFPSFIGNLEKDGLADIYASTLARRYREGAAECRQCRLLSVCRGCLAATHSLGKDVFQDKDPLCFI